MKKNRKIYRERTENSNQKENFEVLPVQLLVDKVLREDGGVATAIFVRFNKKRKAVLCYEYGRQNTIFTKKQGYFTRRTC